jgi:hypothetical protein
MVPTTIKDMLAEFFAKVKLMWECEECGWKGWRWLERVGKGWRWLERVGRVGGGRSWRLLEELEGVGGCWSGEECVLII